jgi:hypothetical protein
MVPPDQIIGPGIVHSVAATRTGALVPRDCCAVAKQTGCKSILGSRRTLPIPGDRAAEAEARLALQPL